MIRVLVVGIMTAVSSMAQSSDEELVVTPHAYGSFEFGQIGHGYYRPGAQTINTEISHITQERCFTNFGFSAKYGDHLDMELIGEGLLAFSYPQIGSEPTTMQPRTFYYIKSSNAKIHYGDPTQLKATLQAGYFPYKYNRDVRNLGENLFRTIPYPLVVLSDFDYPLATLLGLRFNITALDTMITNDLILHSETVTHPVQNWSLSDVVELNLMKVLSVGGGISLYHYFSAYQGENFESAVDSKFKDGLSAEKRLELSLDSISYSAIKLMTRVAIDPKPLLSTFLGIDEGMFGRNDLRLYGELDILGLKKYPGIYDDIKDRMLWSFGFNLPGLNYIDIANVEFEYCANGTAFSDSRFYADIPSLRPDSLGADPNSLNSKPLIRSNWRWSTYVKKSFFNDHFSIIAQVARDHKKTNFYYFKQAYMSFAEVLPTSKDWWWISKVEYKF